MGSGSQLMNVGYARWNDIGATGHQIALSNLWDPRHFIGKFLLRPVAESIFHTVIQIAPSSNRILLLYYIFY